MGGGQAVAAGTAGVFGPVQAKSRLQWGQNVYPRNPQPAHETSALPVGGSHGCSLAGAGLTAALLLVPVLGFVSGSREGVQRGGHGPG